MRIVKTSLAAGGVAVVLAFVLSATGAERALAVVISHVIVDNTPAQAVPVREMSGREPYTVSLSSAWNSGGSTAATASFTVPSGKRLVVEYLSVRAAVPSGQRITQGRVCGPSTPSSSACHAISFVFQGSFNGFDNFTAAQPMRAYLNAGSSSVSVFKNSTIGSSGWQGAVVGYLIPV